MSSIERLKEENLDKFHEIVTSHLSMCLNLENDMLAEIIENKRSEMNESKIPFLKPKKTTNKSQLFGNTLSIQNIIRILPLIKNIQHPDNLTLRNLFRKSGSFLWQQALRQQLDVLDLVEIPEDKYTSHDCAGVLLEFLGELPEPLLTAKHFNAYSQVADLTDELKQISSLQLLVQLLPTENFILLRHLMYMLNAVCKEPKNLMDAYHLAIVFAHHLAMPRTLTVDERRITIDYITRTVEIMIKNAEVLFQYPAELIADVNQYLLMLDEASRSTASVRKTRNGSAFACGTTPKLPSCFSRFSKKIKREDIEDENKDDDEIVISSSVIFADRKASTEAAATINTSTALADLHSYILAMPESAQKRKLVRRMTSTTSIETGEAVDPSKRTVVSKSIRKMFGRKGQGFITASADDSSNLTSCLSPSIRHRCSVSCITPCIQGPVPILELFTSPSGMHGTKAVADHGKRRVTFAEVESVPSGVDVDKSLSVDISYDESDDDDDDDDTSIDINDFECDDSDKENQ